MSGFKNFILRGNLVDVAVAFIVGLSFAAVVTTFTEWLTGLMPDSASSVFGTAPQSFGAFLNAVIAFLIMAAVVYFFVVVPYTKAKEKFFPAEASGPSEVDLLTEIRDSLANRS
jgi:large conductance mechanosensitive channel